MPSVATALITWRETSLHFCRMHHTAGHCCRDPDQLNLRSSAWNRERLRTDSKSVGGGLSRRSETHSSESKNFLLVHADSRRQIQKLSRISYSNSRLRLAAERQFLELIIARNDESSVAFVICADTLTLVWFVRQPCAVAKAVESIANDYMPS